MKREEPQPLASTDPQRKPPREPPRERPSAWSILRALTLGMLVAALIASCVVNRLMGPRLTGTCDGACAHYASCKAGQTDADRQRCKAECPEVFSDQDSLMAFESLSCANAVEFVDGRSTRIVAPKSTARQ